jgi:chaperonin GroES
MDLTKLISEVNIAEKLKEEELTKIGSDVVEGYETDEASRGEWKENLEQWTKMALQIADKKTFPWPNASNIKFPLLSTAAMQFAARAYPTLVPADGKVVKCRVVGSDPTGEKMARANRISKHMSYQVMEEMVEWDEEMDRLLITLPIAGTVFKKTYYDPEKGRNTSCLVMPKDMVVNYWAKSLEDCERTTEIHSFSKRKMEEKIRKGLYLDVKLGHPQVGSAAINNSDPSGMAIPQEDDTTPYVILEQHTFLDLDKDGYPEPYVVIVEKESKKVLRISARFDEEGVQVDEKGKVVSVDPIEYYTKYSFFPNPDGGFYDIGFGRLLGPINASVDTIINQLVDAGTLSNMQGGFIGKGLRIKMGDTKFTPGEWKAVNATGSDIKQQIFPLPVREPSQVLFKLLELLSQSAQQLASVAEIFVGKMPGQNTPATTTMASIEQGMKLFTAVYKRVYRSMAKEFQKLYKLNRVYLDPQVELDIIDEPIEQSDYLGNEKEVIPAADPTAASSQERQQKAQQLMQFMGLGTLNPMAVTQRLLEAMEIPAPEQLMQQPQPQADPKMEAMKMKAQLDQQAAANDLQMEQQKMQLAQAAEANKMQMQRAMKQQEMEFKAQEAALKMKVASLEAGVKIQGAEQESQSKLVQQDQKHRLGMMQGQEKHQLAVKQQREKPKAKPKK